VLRSFKAPGAPSVRVEVLEYLFTLCEVGTETVAGVGSAGELSRPVADPKLLVPLVFGDDRRTSGSGKMINNKKYELANQPTNANIGSHSGFGGVLAKKHQNRSLVGRGPIRVDNPMSEFEATGGDLASTSTGGLETVPLRFVSRKSRTALTTPANFNFGLAKRSAMAPNYECIR
jgi:hypothetical protein